MLSYLTDAVGATKPLTTYMPKTMRESIRVAIEEEGIKVYSWQESIDLGCGLCMQTFSVKRGDFDMANRVLLWVEKGYNSG